MENTKAERVQEAVNAYLGNDLTIEEVSQETGISSSSVQRYLNDREYIELNMGLSKYNEVQEKLLRNKKNGLSKGGRVTQSRVYQTRNETGQYTGNKRKI